MKKVFTSCSLGDAYCVKALLEAEGIESMIRNESLLQGQATVDGHPSVWILDDSLLEAAESIVSRCASSEGRPCGRSWKCPKCGELHDPQFAACWQCGTDRPDEQ
ncbi:MAG: DUF2007 domain-containing protein [Desulfomonilia bacterium]|jgi:hypothetical protein|uniref:RanBP2-type domain-containing protein n=1 Tax=anaerobic digester metagenome TaxID=1263854 RepID=A0A485M1C5_9ZZZZ|nr:DUF2007 domain-containing protein [Pseudomonadota bacterium]HON39539.1 DUF2007 domain-containing protein [Deltaproteobacteria bacterium]HRS57081.1 DUF2007 domain-containing protein [Desulfomonilia bacterium]HPD22248.1 DUF2007 domain-containing protein [Deltaproteobacteria bacterium]HQA72652.1 DUF2007 domain-containing protein [Deltaproteobacteria bacterium]